MKNERKKERKKEKEQTYGIAYEETVTTIVALQHKLQFGELRRDDLLFQFLFQERLKIQNKCLTKSVF